MLIGITSHVLGFVQKLVDRWSTTEMDETFTRRNMYLYGIGYAAASIDCTAMCLAVCHLPWNAWNQCNHLWIGWIDAWFAHSDGSGYCFGWSRPSGNDQLPTTNDWDDQDGWIMDDDHGRYWIDHVSPQPELVQACSLEGVQRHHQIRSRCIVQRQV